jgi:hypothetical protein
MSAHLNRTLLSSSVAMNATLRESLSSLAMTSVRQDRDRWREAFERQQRALPMPAQREATGEATEAAAETAPVSRLRRAWRWMRATG